MEEDVDVCVFVPQSIEDDDVELTGEWRGIPRRDKYGFELDDTSFAQEVRISTKTAQSEEARQREWSEFLRKNKLSQTSALRAIIKRIGVPAEYRRQVWSVLLHLDQRMEQKSGIYQQLLQTSSKENSRTFEQIERDLKRTFPGHTLYDTTDGLAKLRRVLTAYARHNPTIGYCQSMNFISAFLLLVFDEEEAFWVLDHILTNILPPNYYTEHMMSSLVDQNVFAGLIERKLPKLHVHTQTLVHPLSAVTAQWFLCLFVGIMPSEATFRVWDLLLLEGGNIMFVVGLGLLRIRQSQLLAEFDEARLLTMIRDIPKTIYSADELISLSLAKYGSLLSSKTILSLRKKCEPQVVQHIQATNEKRKQAATQRRVCLADFVETPEPPLSPRETENSPPAKALQSTTSWYRISEKPPDSPTRLTIGRRTE